MTTIRTYLLLCLLLSTVMLSAQKIAVLSDIHVSPDNENSRQLQVAVAEINEGDYDVVVMNGDLTNEGADAELTFVKRVLDGISHPLYVVPGNHENNWSQSATKTFNDLWGNDRFVAAIGDVAIVGINCGPYMKMGDGHVKQEDLHWLKSQLDSLSAAGKKIISFNHYPIRKDDLDNYLEYQCLLEQYPVMLHINGHYHKWSEYKAGDIDAVMVRALSVDDSFGYSIIEVKDDEIVVSEKRLSENPQPKYRFPIKTTHASSGEFHDALPESPEGFTVTRVWADSASVFTRLVFDNDNVYFGTSTGLAKAVDKQSGSQLWAVPFGSSIYSRPVVLSSGNVAFPNAVGIKILSTADGCVIADLPSKQGPYVADGLLTDHGIYVQGGYKRMERRDPASGMLIWEYDSLNNYCQAAPVVDGSDLIFGAWDTFLRDLDVNTGTLKWRWSNGRTNNLLSPGNVVPVVTEDKVIIVAPDRYMTAIDRNAGTTVWRDNSHRYRESLGHSEDKSAVYAKTMDGELVAVSTSGDEFCELWLCDLGLGYEHAPCIVVERDGVIYLGSRRGLLSAVSADTHQMLWQLTLGSSEINGIDVDETDGSIWVSLIEGKIYRISKK